MTEPATAAQLHHLADRARRGVLLPAEGALLADGVAELADDRDRAQRSATYRLGVLSKRRQQLHDIEQRALTAEAAIERARALPRSPQVQARIQIHGVPGQEDYNRGWSSAISAVRAALDQPQQPPTV